MDEHARDSGGANERSVERCGERSGEAGSYVEDIADMPLLPEDQNRKFGTMLDEVQHLCVSMVDHLTDVTLGLIEDGALVDTATPAAIVNMVATVR